MPHLLVIGGSDAGISASLRFASSTPGDVTMVVADAYPNFSICGIPFYVSGETPDWHELAHLTLEIEATGLDFGSTRGRWRSTSRPGRCCCGARGAPRSASRTTAW